MCVKLTVLILVEVYIARTCLIVVRQKNYGIFFYYLNRVRVIDVAAFCDNLDQIVFKHGSRDVTMMQLYHCDGV